MGVDMKVVLGKLKTPAEDRDLKETATVIKAVFNKLDVTNTDARDFILDESPEELEINRCSPLFSWLAGVRLSIKPYHDQPEQKQKTDEFLKYLKNFKDPDEEEDRHFRSGWAPDADHAWNRMYGEHSHTLHEITDLLAFDYDKAFPVVNWRTNTDVTSYTSYRELFPEEFFALLEYCKENDYTFIVFGFDG